MEWAGGFQLSALFHTKPLWIVLVKILRALFSFVTSFEPFEEYMLWRQKFKCNGDVGYIVRAHLYLADDTEFAVEEFRLRMEGS